MSKLEQYEDLLIAEWNAEQYSTFKELDRIRGRRITLYESMTDKEKTKADEIQAKY